MTTYTKADCVAITEYLLKVGYSIDEIASTTDARFFGLASDAVRTNESSDALHAYSPDARKTMAEVLAYRPLNALQYARMVEVRSCGQELLELIDDIGPGRECSLAKTKVEEAVIWAVNAVTA